MIGEQSVRQGLGQSFSKQFQKRIKNSPLLIFFNIEDSKNVSAWLSEVFEDGNYFLKMTLAQVKAHLVTKKKGECSIFFENLKDDYMLACISKFADHF